MKSRSSLFTTLALVAAEMLLPQHMKAQNATVNYNNSALIFSRSDAESPQPNWTVGADASGNNFAATSLAREPAQVSPDIQAFGADVTMNFTGTSVQADVTTGPDNGVLAWSLDGGTPNFVDTCSSSPGSTAIANVSGLAPNVPHVLKVEATSSTNCGGINQGLYDFVIGNGAPLPLQNALTAGYNSSQWQRTGNWTCGPDPNDISGGHCWTNDPNATVSWTSHGTLFQFYGRPDKENTSNGTVCIDGGNCKQIDWQWGPTDDDSLNSYLMGAFQLSNGTHTVTLKNGNDGGFMQVDTFAAFSPSTNGGGNSLSAGTYNLVDGGGNLIDFGFAQVGLYPYNNNAHQQVTVNSNGTICDTVGGGTGLCLAEQGGLLTQIGGGDTFSIISVSGGYTIRDNTTGDYLQGGEAPGARMSFSGNPYVWTANSLQTSGKNVFQGAKTDTFVFAAAAQGVTVPDNVTAKSGKADALNFVPVANDLATRTIRTGVALGDEQLDVADFMKGPASTVTRLDAFPVRVDRKSSGAGIAAHV